MASTAQLLTVFSRSQLDNRIHHGELIKVGPGVYSRDEPDGLTRLRGLDLRAGQRWRSAWAPRPAAYGFDTEEAVDLHVLNPVAHQLRSGDGL